MTDTFKDTRTCACGEWTITEYGRWCPSCMASLTSLKVGDKVWINNRAAPFTCTEAAVIVDPADGFGAGIDSDPIFETPMNDVLGGKAQEEHVIWARAGEFRLLGVDDSCIESFDSDGSEQKIWTFAVEKAPEPERQTIAAVFTFETTLDEAELQRFLEKLEVEVSDKCKRISCRTEMI